MNLHDRPAPETDELARKQLCRISSSSNDPADLLRVALEEMEAHARRFEQKLCTAVETLERIEKSEGAPDIDATGEWQLGLHCGVEDRDCRDRYDGADYGHTVGVGKALEWASNEASATLSAIKGDKV